MMVDPGLNFTLLLVRRFRRRIRKAIYNRRLRMAIKRGLQVGDHCNLSGDAYYGTKPYLVKIGSHVDLGRGAMFVTHSGADSWLFGSMPEYAGVKYYDTIEIKDNCFVGVRVTFLPGVTVGPNSIVGAGSVVARDVPPNTVVMGNPARPVCSLDMYRQLTFHKSFRYSLEARKDREKMRKEIEKNLEELHARQGAVTKRDRDGIRASSERLAIR